MKLSIISFTEKGEQLSERISKLLEKECEITLYTKCRVGTGENMNIHSSVLFVETAVGTWAGERMQEKNALLFIGACGIAVRAIAPFLTDKLHDVPVLVMDEKGKYIIPILSGHIGGANELANHIAAKCGAEPVITTATDIHKKFAVDLFAKRNGFYIANKDGIAKVSAKVLAGKAITMSIEAEQGDVWGELGSRIRTDTKSKENLSDAGVRLVPYPPDGFVDIVVQSGDDVFDASIYLKPREYVVGIGCKRGKSVNEIDDFIRKKMAESGIAMTQIYMVSSISQKCDEQGIIEWCQKEGVPFCTYTAEELQEVKGTFTESSFVKAQVGVDNVCERAALKACREGGKLSVPKIAEHGMTIAVAKRKWKVFFDGE